MVSDIATVEPATPTLDAIRTMRENNVTALPVIRDGRLVGIVSEHDFLPILAQLLLGDAGSRSSDE
jgi:CBS domain-containing protein